jgi:hypothetical protein
LPNSTAALLVKGQQGTSDQVNMVIAKAKETLSEA